MELSSLDVRALALELRVLEDAIIDKIYQPDRDEFVIKVRRPGQGAAFLLLAPGAYAALASEAPAAPEQPSTVAMTLRKIISGARIRRVNQHEFDRVIRFGLERQGEPLELVLELFGKGNLLLAGTDGKLILVTRTEVFAHRTVKRGEPLVFPPPRTNPLTMSRADLDASAGKSEKDLIRFLAIDLGLGGDVSEEVVHRAGLSKSLRAKTLQASQLEGLWKGMRDVLDSPSTPVVATTPKGVRPQSLRYESPVFRDIRVEPAATLSEAILRSKAAVPPPPTEDPERARLERQIQHQEKGVVDLEAEADQWENRGHLVYAHYQTIAAAITAANEAIRKDGWSTLQRVQKEATATHALSVFSAVDAKAARVTVNIDGQDVPLDPTVTVEANAALLYDESKRLRAKAEGARVALADARKRLGARATPEAAAPAKAKAPAKRFWFEGFRWFVSSEGFLVVGGRDAAGNEKLVKKHLEAGDRYVHADFHGAPSVVVKGEGRTPGEATMREACQFASTYSRAFHQFAAADAYWVTPEQVSKSAESGEFVAKGSFVIRGGRTYGGKQKLEAAVGVVHLDAQGRLGSATAPHARVVGGPPAALGVHAQRVARVERGEMKPSEAAKVLAPLFRVTVDEVVAALPPGNVRIVAQPEAAS